MASRMAMNSSCPSFYNKIIIALFFLGVNVFFIAEGTVVTTRVNKTEAWARSTCNVTLCSGNYYSPVLCSSSHYSFTYHLFLNHIDNLNKVPFIVYKAGDTPSERELCSVWSPWWTWLSSLSKVINCESTGLGIFDRWCTPLIGNLSNKVIASGSEPDCTAFQCIENNGTTCKFKNGGTTWYRAKCTVKNNGCVLPRCFKFNAPSSGGLYASQYAGNMQNYFGNYIQSTMKRQPERSLLKRERLMDMISRLIQTKKDTTRSGRQWDDAFSMRCSSSARSCSRCNSYYSGYPCLDGPYECCMCTPEVLDGWNY